ncbi:hypothetical protein RND71_042183 [Anisodus tanguticus]|uniref:Uncharacterized protein n=1 Tax=Anisodus tanguticus TaxID=243964 RepID=A0AAE1QQY7_9SOLA|nr:hypothetical protein RND71_042183 [Anisodus tanguticus]
MKILVLVSWLCLIFLKTLPYSSCTFIPKSTNEELILQNENKQKIANDTLLESTSNTKSKEGEQKDVHKVVHQRRGSYGGADLLRKGRKKNGANNYKFERPILVSSLLFSLLVTFTL